MAYFFRHSNGRQIKIPDGGISGEDLIKEIAPNLKPGRSKTIIKGSGAKRIDKNKRYHPKDFESQNGKDPIIGEMPDRTKGGWFWDFLDRVFPDQSKNKTTSPTTSPIHDISRQQAISQGVPLFWGGRSALSKRIILEQCDDISRTRFAGASTRIDYEDAHTFVVDNYRLPKKWHNIPGVINGCTSLAIVFPTEYPKIAPLGFYMRATITDAPNGHFYEAAYHNADKLMLSHGWKWYCVYVNSGNWQPALYRKPGDWRFGDSLWTYFDLIKEALSSND